MKRKYMTCEAAKENCGYDILHLFYSIS